MQAINQAVKDFMSIFENGLQQAANRGNEVIILGGDLNCNFLAKRNNTSVEFKQLKGLLRSGNLTQLIHQNYSGCFIDTFGLSLRMLPITTWSPGC